MSEIPPSFWLDENNSEFPKLSLALTEPNGLIAIGGNLSVERLLKAYSLGIFPCHSSMSKNSKTRTIWYMDK